MISTRCLFPTSLFTWSQPFKKINKYILCFWSRTTVRVRPLTLRVGWQGGVRPNRWVRTRAGRGRGGTAASSRWWPVWRGRSSAAGRTTPGSSSRPNCRHTNQERGISEWWLNAIMVCNIVHTIHVYQWYLNCVFLYSFIFFELYVLPETCIFREI